MQQINKEFEELHTQDPDELILDEYEIKHINKFHEAFLEALRELSEENILDFNNSKSFKCLWLSDCDCDIVLRSVKELNSCEVVNEYLQEFA